MPEKLRNFTDPMAGTSSGPDNVRWVPFNDSAVFARRGGKAVHLGSRYESATANSSNLAGFLELDAAGVTGGHPATISAGDLLPVNFGLEKTCVFPTAGRVATIADVGRSYDISVASNAQYCNLLNVANKVLTVVEVLDNAGSWVLCRIADGKRYGSM